MMTAIRTYLPERDGEVVFEALSHVSTETSATHLAARAAAYLQDLANQQRFSGAVLMARRGEILVSQGYGMANLEHDAPNTPQTRFRIASLSKPLTATAILLLHERGLLHVQDRIAAYLADCPAAWQAMTIEQLLTHSSGIPDYTLFPAFHQQHMLMRRWSPDGLVGLFRDTPLDFQPGERYRYSNSGYVVLGMIIERVSEMSYGSFLEQAIFEPLYMTGTGYDDSRSVLKHRASGYVNTTLKAEYVDTSVSYAAGGLYSTIEDL
jgi:CubicO group peptidase (beta-lactamase class C family)